MTELSEYRIVELKIRTPDGNHLKLAEHQLAFYEKYIQWLYFKPTKPPWVRKGRHKTKRGGK